MIQRSLAVLVFAALLESSCATVARDNAATLSQAGIKVSSVLGDDVEKRAARIAALRRTEGFNAAYDQFSKCKPGTLGATGLGSNGCDVVMVAKAQAASRLSGASASLSNVVSLRARAVRALGKAYQALADEAAFDQPSEVDAAIGPAAEAANQLGSAVGLKPVAGVLEAGIKAGGHALAANAQSRRILSGSRKILAVTQHVRLALQAERDLFGAIDDVLYSSAADARKRLLQAGLLDTSVALKDFAQGVNAPLAEGKIASTLASDQAVRGASEVAALNAAEPARSRDLDVAIQALSDLEALHRRLENGKRLDPLQVNDDVTRLQALVDAMGK